MKVYKYEILFVKCDLQPRIFRMNLNESRIPVGFLVGIDRLGGVCGGLCAWCVE